MVRSDNRADVLGLGFNEPFSRGEFGWDVEFCFQLLLPLRSQQLWAHNQDLRDAGPRNEFARHQPCANRLAQADIVGKQCYRQTAAESD
jgi:hypothetical protein